jgi:MFS family permease
VSTSWGLGLVLGPALGGYLSQVLMETKVAKTIHHSFLEGCKMVKLNFFWVGFFAACHEISKSFCGRIPLCTVRCGKVLKILDAYWFLDLYFII